MLQARSHGAGPAARGRRGRTTTRAVINVTYVGDRSPSPTKPRVAVELDGAVASSAGALEESGELLTWKLQQPHSPVRKPRAPRETAPPAEEAAAAPRRQRIDMSSEVEALVLGGGQSSNPMALHRATPAVPVAGTHRAVDVPLSNCINSGITRMYVFTQWNSSSLTSHLTAAYPPSSIGGIGKDGFVEVLASHQGPDEKEWATGSADAVRRHLLPTIENHDARGSHDPHNATSEYLVLSGESLYKMDFESVVSQHRESGADLTIVTTQLPARKARDYGVLEVAGDGQVHRFAEKPESLKGLEMHGPHATPTCPYTASTGIYVFKREALLSLLAEECPTDEAGAGCVVRAMADVVPLALRRGLRVAATPLETPWRNLASLRDYYESNIAMASFAPPVDMYDGSWPVYTRKRHLPPSVVRDTEIDASLIGEGSLVRATRVMRSVVGNCSYLGEGCIIEDSMLVGSDVYPGRGAADGGESLPGVGARTIVRRAILDRNSRVGKDCQLTNAAGVTELDRSEDGWLIKDGIIVVLAGAVIPDGTVI